jgi:hypothetical protein
MTTLLDAAFVAGAYRFVGPAEVLSVDDARGEALVRRTDEEGDAPVRARVALAEGDVAAGDEVLVLGDGAGGAYVVGRLRVRRPAGPRVEREDRCVRVLSERGELLFEHDAATGRSRVVVPEGDLEVGTASGGIRFRSAGEISLEGERVRVTARSAASGTAASLDLHPARTRITGADVGIVAQRGEFAIGDETHVGRRFRLRSGHARLQVERLETVARTVIESARDVYRKAERLAQLTAGRVRTIVEGTFHLNARKTRMKAKKDFRVDGEKIHLG